MMGFRRIENIYLQYKNGILKEDAFQRIGMGIYQTKVVRQIWKEKKEILNLNLLIFLKI